MTDRLVVCRETIDVQHTLQQAEQTRDALRNILVKISVSDPLHFDVDPDPYQRIYFRDSGSGS